MTIDLDALTAALDAAESRPDIVAIGETLPRDEPATIVRTATIRQLVAVARAAQAYIGWDASEHERDAEFQALAGPLGGLAAALKAAGL